MKLHLIIPALLLTSCASIMESGGYADVDLSSVPTGAAFTTSSGLSGTTPGSVHLNNSVPVTITFALEGYEDIVEVSKPSMSPWILGNIIIGGPLGLIIDLVNPGARVHPGRMRVEMVENEEVAP